MMTETHEKLLRAATALQVATFEHAGGAVPPREAIKGMREALNQASEAIGDLTPRRFSASEPQPRVGRA